MNWPVRITTSTAIERLPTTESGAGAGSSIWIML